MLKNLFLKIPMWVFVVAILVSLSLFATVPFFRILIAPIAFFLLVVLIFGIIDIYTENKKKEDEKEK